MQLDVHVTIAVHCTHINADFHYIKRSILLIGITFHCLWVSNIYVHKCGTAEGKSLCYPNYILDKNIYTYV